MELFKCFGLFIERIQSNMGGMHGIPSSLPRVDICGVSSQRQHQQEQEGQEQRGKAKHKHRDKRVSVYPDAPRIPACVFGRRCRSQAHAGLSLSPRGCDRLLTRAHAKLSARQTEHARKCVKAFTESCNNYNFIFSLKPNCSRYI